MFRLLHSALNRKALPISESDIRRQPHGLRARILASSAALLVSQGVTAAIYLISVPLFLHFWDAARYGKWVILTAVPTYFAMSDGGIVPVAANKISILQAGGNTSQADVVFQSALALVVAAILLIGAGSALVLASLSGDVLDSDSRLALWLLIVGTLFSLTGGLFDAGFRAFGSYAHGVLYANGIRVLEFLGLAIGLQIAGTFTAVALGMLAGRSAGLLYVAGVCRRRFPELKWTVVRASKKELRALLQPALTFMAFPLGNGITIQGITLIVGAQFGTVVVAVFNTYRTMSRLVLQTTATFCNAVWAEFSRIYGAGEAALLRRVYRRAMLIGAAISLALSVAMVPAAPPLLKLWTHGKIGFDRPLFLLFALATLVGGIAYLPRVLLLATNSHSRLGVAYVGLATIGAVAAYFAVKFLGTGGAVLATTGVEASMLFCAIALAKQLLSDMPERSSDGRA